MPDPPSDRGSGGSGGSDTTTVTATQIITEETTIWSTIEKTISIETTVSIVETSYVLTTVNQTLTATEQVTLSYSPSLTTRPITFTIKQPSSASAITTSHDTKTVSHSPSPASSISAPVPHPTASAVPVGKKHLSPGDILAIVFGITILVLLGLMWFLVRRFYRMYRAERVMRKQTHTEGIELPKRTFSGRTAVEESRDAALHSWKNVNA